MHNKQSRQYIASIAVTSLLLPAVAQAECFRDQYGNVRCTNRLGVGTILGIAAGILILISALLFSVGLRRRRLAQRANLSYLQNQTQAAPMGGYYPPQPQYPVTGTGYFQGTPSDAQPLPPGDNTPGRTFGAPPGQTFNASPSQPPDFPTPAYYPPPNAPPPQHPANGDKGYQLSPPLQVPPPAYQQPPQKTGE